MSLGIFLMTAIITAGMITISLTVKNCFGFENAVIVLLTLILAKIK